MSEEEKKKKNLSGDTGLLVVVNCSEHCGTGVDTIFKSTEWRKWETRLGFITWD